MFLSLCLIFDILVMHMWKKEVGQKEGRCPGHTEFSSSALSDSCACIGTDTATSDGSPLPLSVLATSCLLPVGQCLSSFFSLSSPSSLPSLFRYNFSQLWLPYYEMLIPQIHCLHTLCMPVLCAWRLRFSCLQEPAPRPRQSGPLANARCRLTF